MADSGTPLRAGPGHRLGDAPVSVHPSPDGVAAVHVGGGDLPEPGRPPRVLLVEDDDGDAVLVEELLAGGSDPFEIVRARSVADALPRLRDGVECVLLDLGLPDAQGLEALRGVMAAAGDSAVICLTGLDDEHRAIGAVAAGAQDYLIKGQVDEHLLHRAVRYAMERRRADRQARELYASRVRDEENARLERGLLPLPQVRDPAVTVTTRYRPGRGAVLGGDFYDVVETEDGTVHVVIGDVSGHGPDQAALGVCLRIAWRTLILVGAAPRTMLGILEEILLRERRSDEVFTTLAMAVVSPDRASAQVWLAGHPAPVLLDPEPSQVDHPNPGPALGLIPGSAWTGASVALTAPWRLLLFTDGIFEGRVGDGPVRLGLTGLRATLAEQGAGRSTAVVLDGLMDRVHELNRGPLPDDVALVAIEWAPAGGPGR